MFLNHKFFKIFKKKNKVNKKNNKIKKPLDQYTKK